MVVATGGTAAGIDMRGLDLSALYDGTITKQTSTAVDVDEGDGFKAHFIGQGFAFDIFGQVGAGTITGISEDYLGVTTFSLTGLNLNATQFYQWVQTDDAVTAITTVLGGDDAVTGTVFDDYLGGFSGHDVLAGGAGADTLIGGDGNDHLYGQSANGGSDAADYLSGGNGADYLQGNAGNDTLDGGNGSDRINGGANDDSVTGGAGNDTVNGNLGNDAVDGGDDNDSLRGGQGDDSIAGGNGNDLISGDKGVDALTGGAGNDQFRFAAGDAAISSGSTDKITDYVHGSDHVGLGITPAAVLTGSTQASFSAAQTFAQTLFDGHSGDHEVAAVQVGSDTYLFFAGNAGSTIDSAVMLQGVSAASITAADFV